MTTIIKKAQEAVFTDEIQEVAKILAKYNLGICLPHMHDEQTGEISLLPAGVISVERNLRVSFEQHAVVEAETYEPVAWRWNGNAIEVCSSCCGGSGPGVSD